MRKNTQKIVASRMGVLPETLHLPTLRRAAAICETENPRSKNYWNALAHSGQLHGNVPYFTMTAIVYRWIMGDSN